MDTFSIERITKITDDIVEAAQRLALQLHSPNQGTITPEYLEKMVSNPDHYWLVARTDEGRIIGMASLFIMRVPTNIRSSLENVVVDEASRSLGIGHALHKKAFEIADEQGVNTLRTATWKENTAVKSMLAELGFEIDTDLTYYEGDIHQGARF
ncbi:MAG: GNAT family N-acetyltransferase [Patescibacteria group bacterium]